MTPAQLAQRRAAGIKGGAARAKQFTSEYQRMARSHVKRDSLQAAGRKGFQSLIAKHGTGIAAKRFADWRHENPTALETIIIAYLAARNVQYKREVEINGAYADFVVNNFVVEVDGKHWHEVNDHVGEGRPARDILKDQLFTQAGYTVIRLSEQEIASGVYIIHLQLLCAKCAPVDITESHLERTP